MLLWDNISFLTKNFPMCECVGQSQRVWPYKLKVYRFRFCLVIYCFTVESI